MESLPRDFVYVVPLTSTCSAAITILHNPSTYNSTLESPIGLHWTQACPAHRSDGLEHIKYVLWTVHHAFDDNRQVSNVDIPVVYGLLLYIQPMYCGSFEWQYRRHEECHSRYHRPYEPRSGICTRPPCILCRCFDCVRRSVCMSIPTLRFGCSGRSMVVFWQNHTTAGQHSFQEYSGRNTRTSSHVSCLSRSLPLLS